MECIHCPGKVGITSDIGHRRAPIKFRHVLTGVKIRIVNAIMLAIRSVHHCVRQQMNNLRQMRKSTVRRNAVMQYTCLQMNQ
jgi:hypothetical protein